MDWMMVIAIAAVPVAGAITWVLGWLGKQAWANERLRRLFDGIDVGVQAVKDEWVLGMAEAKDPSSRTEALPMRTQGERPRLRRLPPVRPRLPRARTRAEVRGVRSADAGIGAVRAVRPRRARRHVDARDVVEREGDSDGGQVGAPVLGPSGGCGVKPGVFAAVARRDLEDGRMTFTADRDSGEVAIWSGGARIGVVNRESVELASTSSSVLDEVVGALRRSDADGYVECFTCLSRITAKAWQTVGQKMPVLCGSCADDRGITR